MARKDRAQDIAYNNRWIAETQDRINLTLPKGRKAEIQAAAKRAGQSVNAYIAQAIDQRAESGK